MSLKRLRGRKFNSYDLLKDIAFFIMLIDHIGLFMFHGKILFFRVIGRAAVIIYAILFGSGKKKREKMGRIMVAAIILSLIHAHIYNRIFPLNIMYNFYLANLLVDYLNILYNGNTILFFIVIALLGLCGVYTCDYLEYGPYLLLLVFCGKIFRKSEKTPKDKTVTISIFLMFALAQILRLDFRGLYSVAALLLIGGVYRVLFNFKIREMENVPGETLLMFISRYSLELFIVQAIIFLGINLWTQQKI
ncbi:MAG: conjugal transfer protein TraX [Rickettsiales bacterium]|jgi:hypothetical protein|nr:conjugal transfer protein TraX [Rickettsiales bacterium]